MHKQNPIDSLLRWEIYLRMHVSEKETLGIF